MEMKRIIIFFCVSESGEKIPIDIHVKNIQDIMDAMMKETMDKQETPMDTDLDVTPPEVVVSPDNSIISKSDEKDIKTEVKEEISTEDVKTEKNGEENNIRVSKSFCSHCEYIR